MKDLKEISTRLEIAKKNLQKKQTKNKGTNAASFGKALKISTELVAAVLVGSTLGFILDSSFDTKPLLTICFFIIGVAAGILKEKGKSKEFLRNF